MVSLVSENNVLAAVQHARSVLLTTYVLRPGAMRRAIEDAARRGAKVTVRLEGSPYHDDDGTLLRENQRAIKHLQALGADARLVHASDGDGPPLHMKAIVAEGIAFLDDRNWPDDGRDTIVRDTFPADVRAVKDAALGTPDPPGRFFWTDKVNAIRGQARLLYGAGDAREVDVESEAFGVSPQTFGALKKLAAQGVHCRLLVSERDVSPKSQPALNFLAKHGVEIRAGDFDEKIAVVDGKRAWVGSANATSIKKDGDQIDWGLRTDDPALVRGLDEHFRRNWEGSVPLDDVDDL